MNRDEVLPSVVKPESFVAAMNLNKDFASGYVRGSEAQRDADWERFEKLVEALEGIASDPCLAVAQEAIEDGLHTPCPSCRARLALAQWEVKL